MALLVLCSSSPGQGPGYIVSVSAGPYPTLTGLMYVPPQGGSFTQFLVPQTLPPYSTLGPYLAQLPGNRRLLVDESYAVNHSAFRYHLLDRDTLSYSLLGTFPGEPGFPRGYLVDQEGDLVMVLSPFSGGVGTGLYRLTPGGFQRFAGAVGHTWGRVFVDLDTGDYVTIAAIGRTILRVTPSGQVSTMATLPNYGRLESQDPETGEFLAWVIDPQPSLVSTLYKVTTSGTVTATSIRVGDPKNLEVDETPSAAGEYVFVTLWGSLARVGRAGGPFFPLAAIPYVFAHDMVLDAVRNVSTVGSGNNR
jgi:hypothetical protein